MGFVVARWEVAERTGHVLYALDPAEYAYFDALVDVIDKNPDELARDPASTDSFLRGARDVADAGLHGTTLLAAWAVRRRVDAGAPLSTWTLRELALAQSTALLALWLLLLALAWRSPGPVLAFGALFIAGPAVLVKLNLLLWGTHDTALLLHALLLFSALPLLGRPRGPLGTLVGAAAFGAASSALCLLNFTLLLPAALTAAWLLGEAGLAAWRAGGARRAVAVALPAAGVGVAASLLTWRLVVGGSDVLTALGWGTTPFTSPRVGEVATLVGWQGPIAWVRDALPRTAWLIPALAAAVWILADALRSVRRGEERPASRLDRAPFTLFLAAYLLLAWVFLAAVPLAWTGEPPAFQQRFAAHLYPVAGAVLVGFCWTRRWIGPAALVVLLAVGVVPQWRIHQRGHDAVRARFDGARLYCELRGNSCRRLPPDRYELGGASRPFLRGMGVLTLFQDIEQLAWPPLDRLEDPVEPTVRRWVEVAADPGWTEPERRDFYRGLGYGLGLLYPDGSSHLDPLWRGFEEADLVREGLEIRPSGLRWGGARLTPTERAALVRQLEGDWQALPPLDGLRRLVRLEEGAPIGTEPVAMSVTERTLTLRPNRTVQLHWTPVHGVLGRFTIATVDRDGHEERFRVTFEPADRLSLTHSEGGLIRFERADSSH